MVRPSHSCWLPNSSSQCLLLSPHVCGRRHTAANCMLPHQLHASCCTLGSAACYCLHRFCANAAHEHLLRCFVQIGFMGPAFFLTQLSKVTTAGQAVGCMMACQGLDAFSQSGLYSNHQVSFQRIYCPLPTYWACLLCLRLPSPCQQQCKLWAEVLAEMTAAVTTISASSWEGCACSEYFVTNVIIVMCSSSFGDVACLSAPVKSNRMLADRWMPGFPLQDIAPRYSGVLLGMSNTAGVLAGVLGTAATGMILKTGSWDDVWHVSIILYCVGTLIWNLMSTGERVID